MSFRATRWALAQEIGHSTAKLVLAILADYADDTDFSAYPCQATLARRAHCSRRQIIRILKQLEQQGFLRRIKRGARSSDLFILNFCSKDLAARKSSARPYRQQNIGASIAAATLAIMGN